MIPGPFDPGPPPRSQFDARHLLLGSMLLGGALLALDTHAPVSRGLMLGLALLPTVPLGSILIGKAVSNMSGAEWEKGTGWRLAGSFFFIYIGVYAALGIYNAQSDKEPGRDVITAVRARAESGWSGQRRVAVDSWRTAGETEEVELGAADYTAAEPRKTQLHLLVMAGALSFNWIAKAEVQPLSPNYVPPVQPPPRPAPAPPKPVVAALPTPPAAAAPVAKPPAPPPPPTPAQQKAFAPRQPPSPGERYSLPSDRVAAREKENTMSPLDMLMDAHHHEEAAEDRLRAADMRGAADEFALAIKDAPTDPTYRIERALTLMVLKDWKNAADEWAAAEAHLDDDYDPRHLKCALGIGDAYYAEKEMGPAIAAYGRAVGYVQRGGSVTKDTLRAYSGLGDALAANGQKDAAILNYQKAESLTNDPTDQSYLDQRIAAAKNTR